MNCQQALTGLRVFGWFNVTYGGHPPTAVSAGCQASNSDDNYLGWIWPAIDADNRIVALVSSQSAYDKWGYNEPVEEEKLPAP